MLRGQYRRLKFVSIPLNQTSVVDSGQFCKADPSGLDRTNAIAKIWGDAYTVGRGSLRMTLAGPAVTVDSPPKGTRLKEIRLEPCFK